MQLLPLSRVRLTGGPFAAAVRTDLAYALALDVDRLLAPFVREAGLPATTASYGNWEDSGLDGHIAGHLLSALSHLWAATGEADALRRVDHLVDTLARCQDAGGSGYVGGIPGGRALFENLAHGGRTAVARLAGSDHWVPWYNLHKTFQGLLDAHAVAGSTRALEVVVRLADWWHGVAATIDEATFEAMLDTEFGGMNEAFALLGQQTGRPEDAAMAGRFAHRRILDPLRRDADELTGLHANTQIPKAVGYAATASLTGDGTLRAAADAFWRTVVERRTVAIGGNSVREHFHALDDFTPMIDDREGPEFCNTYNMLKLTRALAADGLRPEHLDYAERALFNHVLASQHPDGGFVYFTSMRPRHYRVYSRVHDGFWCCVGTGLEAQARYGEWVFGIEDEALAVNLFVAAEADVPGYGWVRVDTDFPRRDAVAVELHPASPREFALRLRVPGWAGALEDLRINGAAAETRAVPGAIVLHRRWHPGDRITFRAPLRVRAERMPDGSPWQSYAAGPIVLAARAGTRHLDGLRADDSRMGHIAHGPLYGLGELPIVAGGADGVREVGALRYEVAALDPASAISLEPFSGIHDERYTVYWPVSDGSVAARRADLERHDEGLAVDAATVDSVALGEQQPESDHDFRGDGSEVVVRGPRRWRVTRGAMSLRLGVDGAHRLRIGFATGGGGGGGGGGGAGASGSGSGSGSGVIVRLGGEVLAHERFDAGAEHLEVDYPIRAALDAAGSPVSAVVELIADGVTPGITAVRTLR